MHDYFGVKSKGPRVSGPGRAFGALLRNAHVDLARARTEIFVCQVSFVGRLPKARLFRVQGSDRPCSEEVRNTAVLVVFLTVLESQIA